MAATGGRQLRNGAHLLIAGLVLLVVVGVVYGAYRQFTGDLGCEHEAGDSNYGTLSWSVVPPGPVCTFTQEVNGIEDVQGPGPVMSLWLLTLAGGGLAAGAMIRRADRLDET